MEVCHVESAVFDDPNLVSCAGLGPVVALAEQCGLPQLVAAQLTLPAKAGVNAHLKVPALVGAMVAGADSIADTDLLRHGGTELGGVDRQRELRTRHRQQLLVTRGTACSSTRSEAKFNGATRYRPGTPGAD